MSGLTGSLTILVFSVSRTVDDVSLPGTCVFDLKLFFFYYFITTVHLCLRLE